MRARWWSTTRCGRSHWPRPRGRRSKGRPGPRTISGAPTIGSAPDAVFLDDLRVASVRALALRARRESLGVLREDRLGLEQLHAQHVAHSAAEDHVGHRERVAEDEVAVFD